MTKCRTIPLLDLKAQHASIQGEVMAAVERVLAQQALILGPEVEALERELAGYCGAAHAIGCGSGSDALFLALLALDVGPGDEVLTTPYTFFATAGSIVRCGARPVFADIDPETFNLDPEQAAAALERHERVKAIMPVHLFGGCADMEALGAVAARRGVAVIEDAAQALGAEDRGRRAGSMGAAGCFSFYPSKNLGGAGEGGLLTTQDAGLADRLRALRVHGSRRRYFHDEVGVNSRLDALQAAILRVKFKHLDIWTARRQENAALYDRLFAANGAPVKTPARAASMTRHVVNQYVILAPRRDELRAHLAEQGIGTEVYYPLPLHRQACFAGLGYGEGAFPVSERVARESLALPVYPELTEDDLRYVAEQVAGFYAKSGHSAEKIH